METEELEVITFRDLFEFIRRGFLTALLVGLVAGGLAYFVSSRADPTYRARATLLASQPSGTNENFGVTLVTAPPVDVSAYRSAATSYPVLSSAMAELGIDDPGQEQVNDFRERIDVRTETTNVSSLLHIEVEGTDAQLAAARAQALANALLAWDTSRATGNLEDIIATLEAQITALDAQIAALRAGDTPAADAPAGASPGDQPEVAEQLEALQDRRADYMMQLNSARALRSSAVGRLEILEPALVPIEPVAPRPLLTGVLAFVLGVFLRYGVMLLRDALDTRLRSTEDLARTSGLPVLAEFPKQTGMRRLPREASSYLRTNLLFLTANAHPKVIAVTSSHSAHGKSSVALSLAESFARNDHRTLLIDADLRKPVLGREYSLDSSQVPPLRAHLENPHEELPSKHVMLDKQVGLDVIPSFDAAPNPSELLSQGFQPFLRRKLDEYDVIIIDTAPVLPVADTLTIVPHTTGVVFAVSLGNSDRRSLTNSLDLLNRLGVRMLGVVSTNMESTRSGTADGYGYGYGYGYGPQETEEQPNVQDRKNLTRTG